MSEEIIYVNYSLKDIQKVLSTRFKDPADIKLAEVIVGYLKNQNHALPGLLKSLQGMYPSTSYMKGDMVWVKFSTLPSWKMDKAKTKTLPHYNSDLTYDKEGVLMAQIIYIDVYQSSPYSIEFSAYEAGVIKQMSYQLGDHNIAYKEESFLDILDALEKVEAPREDDATF